MAPGFYGVVWENREADGVGASARVVELWPRIVEKLPHDIIGGPPLHYRRTPDGKFLLYSAGWNETDDGGQARIGQPDFAKGGWVWHIPDSEDSRRHSDPRSAACPTLQRPRSQSELPFVVLLLAPPAHCEWGQLAPHSG